MSEFENPEDANLTAEGIYLKEENTIVVNAPPRPKKQTRFNIETFRSEFSKDNFVSTHSYLVTFSKFNSQSRILSRFVDNNASLLTMRCDNAILPGVRLLKDETIRRYGYGPIERVPYGVQFNDITLNWIADSQGKIVEFFNYWMRSIVNYDSAGGRDMQTTSRINGLTVSPYEIGYKDNYANPKMNIFIYDHQLDQVIIYELFDAFPSAINDVPVAWGEQDTMLKYSIEFSYTDINILTPKTMFDIPDRIKSDYADIDSQFNDARYSDFIGDARSISTGLGRLFSGSF